MKKFIKEKKISIIIRTRNEERWIGPCLKKIFEQNYKNFEVILVDNNSKDKTIQKAKLFPIKIVKIKNFLPGKAINLGIKNASGQIIVCLSAHCIPIENNWLNKLASNLKDRKIAGVYGRQKPLSYSSDFDKRDLLNLFGPEKKIQRKDTFFHNANSAFRKDVWKKFPFDEKTKHIEDRIWGSEVIKKGYKIIYEPEASVYHWHGINQDMEPERCKRIVNILESLGNDYKSKNIDNVKSTNCLAIIPLRGKSLEIDKNFSLLKITINQMKKSKIIKDIYVATDNLSSRKIGLEEGAKVPFLRPQNLSANYVDIKTTISYFVNKLYNKGVTTDLIVLATENFPLRDPSIFDKMINQLISNNYDVVIGINEEKGSVFLDDFKRKKLIFNGEVPKKLRLDKVLVSRIGLCTVIRSSVLSSGSIFSGRIGYFPINNHMSFMEFTNKKGISKNLKQLIINHNKKI